MGQHHHDAGLVRTGVDLQLFGDADEPGVVIVVVLDAGTQAAEAVELGTGAAAEGGHIGSAGICHHFSCNGRIGYRNNGDTLQGLEEFTALVDGLFVGVDFLDIGDFCALFGKQIVVHLHPEGPDDGEIVGDHQIVDLFHRTCGGILNGQDAVLAQALVDGVEHRLKVLEIENGGGLEDLLTGDLAECALHTLTGHHGSLGEESGGVFNGGQNVVVLLSKQGSALALVAAAQLKKHGVQHPGIIGHFRACLGGYIRQLFPLPGGDKNGKPLFLLIVGDPGGHIHPFAEEADKLIVNGVDFFSVIFQIHQIFLLFVWVLPRIRS